MSFHTDNPYFLILAAAGSSSRMEGNGKKEYLEITYHGKKGTVLSVAALAFLKTIPISAIIITIPDNDNLQAKQAFFSNKELQEYVKNVPVIFTTGGTTRQKSILEALKTISVNPITQEITTSSKFKPLVLIHDAARPFVTSQIILDTVSTAKIYGAAVPVIPPVDTQKEINTTGIITKHLSRSHLGAVQTPQVFFYEDFFIASKKAEQENIECTDDTEIWDYFCGPVHVTKGNISNKKITYAEDINYFSDTQLNKERKKMNIIRTGFGYDLHRLKYERKLIIGGVQIPFEKGEDGHSDGDVLLHAIMDALLGASALGDIGSRFPPSDIAWKDADSTKLLKEVWKDVQSAGWILSNLDCVIVLEEPKFNPFRTAVINSIASILNVSIDQIFVKAKTKEKLGDIGAGNAIEAYASCLLTKN